MIVKTKGKDSISLNKWDLLKLLEVENVEDVEIQVGRDEIDKGINNITILYREK